METSKKAGAGWCPDSQRQVATPVATALLEQNMKLNLTRESAKDLGMIWYKNHAWEVTDFFDEVGLNIKGDLDLEGCKSLKSLLPTDLVVDGKVYPLNLYNT